MSRSKLLVGTGIIVLSYPAAAIAQAAPVASLSAMAPSDTSEAATSDAGIVVTARKRAESIQQVPIAVSAFSPAMLAKQQINNVLDVGPAVPSLIVSPSQGSQNGATVFIRGIGQDNSSSLDESGVGIYVDGVYLGRQIGSLLDFNNIERIEVLRGPQGTLYGRNTPGGAVKIVSKRPSFDKLGFTGDLTTGSFSRLDGRATVNIPVSSSFAVSVSAMSLNNDGFYKDSIHDQRLNKKATNGVRFGALWQATDNFSLYFTGDYTRDRSGLAAGTPFDTTGGVFTPLYGSLYKAAPDLPDINKYDGGGVAMTAEWKLPGGTFSSISAYRRMRYNQSFDFGSSPIGSDMYRHLKDHQFSEELQYVSSLSGKLNFVAGLYYFREHSNELFDFLINAEDATATTAGLISKIDLPYFAAQTTNSYSAYGEAYYTPFDPLTITVGGRYTRDEKTIERAGIPGTGTGKVHYNNFSPKVNVDYHLTATTHGYVTWSKGYKAGSFQPFPDTGTAFLTVPPEKVTTWEVGLKSEVIPHLLTLDLAAYHTAYKDLQLNLASSSGAVVINSADLRVRGVEAEWTLTPAKGFSVTGSLAVSGSHFWRVPAAGSGGPLITDRQKNLPDYQLRIAPDYSFELANADTIEIGGAFTAMGKDQKILPNDPFHLQKAYQLVDARLVYSRPRQGWSIELDGKNLTNTHYFTTSTLLGGATSSVRWYQPGATWALRFGLKF